LAASAHGFPTTIATFADPTGSAGEPPVFSFDAVNQLLTGGWAGDGLTLQTYIATYSNATFTMTLVVADSSVLPTQVGGGTIRFYASGGQEVFVIDFDSGDLGPLAFGATEFLNLNVVTFSGAIIPVPYTQESFAFSFANQLLVGEDGSFTATAAFTSSALVPEPGMLTLVVIGLVMAGRRHRQDAC